MLQNKATTPRNVSDERNGNQNLEVGDIIDIPGGMHGTIRFIGEVRGKAGTFAGVELSREWAARGKNNGDVDGVKYFNTNIKNAGIFLPASKAYKRPSPRATKQETGLSTPSRFDKPNSTPILPSKFSQSVGPGRAGARSPEGKARSRPSLPRPESPLRKAQNAPSTPGARPSIGNPKLAKSMIAGSRYAPSPTPGRFGASIGVGAGDPGKKAPITPKSNLKKTMNGPTNTQSEYRSESRTELGPEPMFDSESDNTPIVRSRTVQNARTTQTTTRPVSTQNGEIQQLKSQLADRDKQLERQAADIEEMQNSVNELQLNAPTSTGGVGTRSSRGSGMDELDASSLRALVREKNDKIKQLTEEFDAHRADFRDTIDILEHTSDETNRLHQEKIDSLQVENRELQDRMERGEDIDALTQTLKQLDEQVQELEEGLEDARRGEAEARGEAEFLRGEVERGKAELDRERQKTTSKAVQEDDSDLKRELKRRDDEIKGLRAIIHSLNQSETTEKGSPNSTRRTSKQRDSSHAQTNGHGNEHQILEMREAQGKLEKEVKDLQDLVDRKTYREEELENEIQRLQKTAAHTSAHSNGLSEHTTRANSKYHTPDPSNASTADFLHDQIATGTTAPSSRFSRDQVQPTPESDGHSTTMTDASNLWCDLCDTAGHDILHCTNMGNTPKTKQGQTHAHARIGSDDVVRGDHREHASPRGSHTQSQSSRIDPQLSSMGSPSNDHRPTTTAYTSRPPPPSSSSAGVSHHHQQPPPPQAVPTPNLMDSGLVPGKASGIADENKWCGICERDGHDATDCPFESQF